ncbi:MAG: serine/threonine protein kinase [Nocardiaceae bacterium]|nr:serine/threonine protein kinase [Nocardiaceae bacterium]
MQESDVPFAPGRVLAGRYRIERRIARGGMADVYAAIDPVLSRKVAIKAFRLDTTSAADHRRVDREIRMLASLRDPGLVTVFDAGFVPDGAAAETPFLVMELIEGPTLSDRLKGKRLSQNEVARLGAEVASTLIYVHKIGIVHRDIKPANILLDPIAGGFRAKLADFGIARLVDSTRYTAVGAAVGTANYVSPEQALGEPIGPPSDIYSLALILIECLSGSVVFPGAGVEAVSPRLHRDPTMPKGVTAEWESLLERMTARRPGDRPTAAQVAQELTALVQGNSQSPVPPPPTAILTPPPAKTTAFATKVAPLRTRRSVPKRPLAIAGAAIVAAVLGLGLWAAIPSDDVPPPTYPTVDGQLGVHLGELEGAIP